MKFSELREDEKFHFIGNPNLHCIKGVGDTYAWARTEAFICSDTNEEVTLEKDEEKQ